MSARELLDALRAARAEETVASVLNSPQASWRNMNQNSPRSLMRDQVDTRETVGVGKWLSFHQQQLQDSERRRVDNRMKAQEVFDQSQYELAALKEEMATSLAFRQMAQPVERQLEPEQHYDSPTGAGVPSNAESSIGVVRDNNLLGTMVNDRDTTIERLQHRIRADRNFYQTQIAKLHADAKQREDEAAAKIVGLRARLERALSHQASEGRQPQSDGTNHETSLESKIDELQVMFQNTLEGVKNRTTAELEAQQMHFSQQMTQLSRNSETLILASKEVFKRERAEAMSQSRDLLLIQLGREQNEYLASTESTILNSVRLLTEALEAQVANGVTAAVERELHNTPIAQLKDFVTDEVRGNVMISVGEELSSAVAERVAVLTSIFESEMKAGRQSLFQIAANFAGIDAKRVDGILSSTQLEFKDIRHEAQKAANVQRLEHLEFMSKTRLILERIKQSKSNADRYVTV